ncbi:MBOAT family O-acyltransferase [Maribacter sp. 4G9]|uniref:MBOAT family O-acyltransferase n=1 Tax=Maribacter sp. 4G9 TaxID=1889777 RepID=UPI000C154C35|nr:MBOAT family O-acyltransferase [Maribacter sp. 4G9]PIB38371.1 acyltransferase [Maribacter sp. 4G9]
MLFNSFEFLVFLIVVFGLYWFVFNTKTKHQNILLLLASYSFYGWWDYRFLSLIFISTLVDYVVGLQIHGTVKASQRKVLLGISLAFNIGLLAFFKYFNFFVDSWIQVLDNLGYLTQNTWSLNIILPVGISFYTFQTMSYTIDVYRKKLVPTKDFISFAAFVSFFPQLVAGPIERASNLLPQILGRRNFSYEKGMQGLRLILWGLVKKVVIADVLALKVDDIFGNYHDFGGGVLWLGAVYFAIQIYCDFSGYSDIAIGVSKLFGIELMSNFKFPYFSRNVGEFWRRWHISLSTWFRDYLYIPLGGSRMGKWKSLNNVFVIFLISGLWHGANWTFVVWGAVHALLFVPSYIMGRNRKYTDAIVAENSWFPTLREFGEILLTFLLVVLAWVFFRSESLASALEYLNFMFTKLDFPPIYKNGLYSVGSLLFLDWIFRKDERLNFTFLKNINKKVLGIAEVAVLIIVVYLISLNTSSSQFIYFQF